MCETLLLVSAKTAGLIEVAPYENVVKDHACMTAKDIMHVNPASAF